MEQGKDNFWITLMVWSGLIVSLFLLTGLSVMFYRMTYPPQANEPLFQILYPAGKPEIYSSQERQWKVAARGDKVGLQDKIRTKAGEEVDFYFPNKMYLRLKENSAVEVKQLRIQNREPVPTLHLQEGTLLGAADRKVKDQTIIEAVTPNLKVDVKKALFDIQTTPDGRQGWVGVLEGKVAVKPPGGIGAKSQTVGTLQKIKIEGSKILPEPNAITTQEWSRMREAYELIPRSAAFEAEQIDLSKNAGDLFRYAFDHGTFYSPKSGFCDREFVRDGPSGAVYLEINYDVFPPVALVGVYFKTRGFDLSRFESLEFEVRRAPEENFPEGFRIEIKSKTGTAKTFFQRDFEPDWKKVTLPLDIAKPVLISEITFVFSNETVGPDKKGALQFRNFHLVTKPIVIKPQAPLTRYKIPVADQSAKKVPSAI